MNFDDKKLIKKLDSLQNIPTIVDLKDNSQTNNNFKISTKEDVLYSIIENNNVIVVAGAFFGDEGKGKTVDAVAEHPKIGIIARVNSGENAGHTVFHNGKKFIFNLMPSGIFSGKLNLIGSNCVMDLVSFMEKEVKQLIDAKIDYSNLIIGNVSLVMPYHKIMDAFGKANSSTLKGMSPIHSSKVRKQGLRLDDLHTPFSVQEKIVQKDMEYYYALIKHLNIDELKLKEQFEEMNKNNKVISDHVINFLGAKDKVKFILDLYNSVFQDKTFPKTGDVNWHIQQTLKNGKKVLLEGPQSYYLSNNVVMHWRCSTSADTTALGIMAAAGYNTSKYKTAIINVHKAPGSSRVGLGVNPSGFASQSIFSRNNITTLKDFEGKCENFEEIEKQFYDSINENGILKPTIYTDKDKTEYPINVAMAIASAKKFQECGSTTKKPRITGMFDCVAHHKVNQIQGPYLTISAIDRGDDSEKVGLVIAYVVSNPDNKLLISNGKKYNHGDVILPGEPIPNETVLYNCSPIIKVMEGWKETPIGNKKFTKEDTLPINVQNFLKEIEFRTESKIISIGNGPEREDLIYLK
jgi:adenylosuccinate synthase